MYSIFTAPDSNWPLRSKINEASEDYMQMPRISPQESPINFITSARQNVGKGIS